MRMLTSMTIPTSAGSPMPFGFMTTCNGRATHTHNVQAQNEAKRASWHRCWKGGVRSAHRIPPTRDIQGEGWSERGLHGRIPHTRDIKGCHVLHVKMDRQREDQLGRQPCQRACHQAQLSFRLSWC